MIDPIALAFCSGFILGVITFGGLDVIGRWAARRRAKVAAAWMHLGMSQGKPGSFTLGTNKIPPLPPPPPPPPPAQRVIVDHRGLSNTRPATPPPPLPVQTPKEPR